nr:hypothetical protein [uncultured Desulfobacter sp.]
MSENIKEQPFQVPFMPDGWNLQKAVEHFPEIILTDASGTSYRAETASYGLEHDTSMRKTVLMSGVFSSDTTLADIEWQCRLSFYNGKTVIKSEFTIINTQAACHAGGAWDLGDKNSFLFRDLTAHFRQNGTSIGYIENFEKDTLLSSAQAGISIYQGSSGLSNWHSKNHMNRNTIIPVRLDGYKVIQDEKESFRSNQQSSPLVLMGNPLGEKQFFCYLEYFWQNFPKQLSAQLDGVSLGLFPENFGDLFELQPGEQKTHSFYFGNEFADKNVEHMQWVTAPLVPEIKSTDFYKSMLRPGPVPVSEYSRPYDEYIGNAIEGPHSFKAKNELIDEYGWRNFGDIFADHESVFKADGTEFISHYNNQYDVIKGAVLQYMRTGDTQWFKIAKNYADHVCDIDIYHTDQDKYQYNHGLFWHTDHHLDAHTCTHRTISEKHRSQKPDGAFGGGPYLEHNYATGLVYLYWMTGNERYRTCALELCSFIENWIAGPDTMSELLFQTIRNGIKKIKSFGRSISDEIYVFQGPSRASGNSLNTLLDGYLLTENKKYLSYAEQVISNAVHPEDDQDGMNLLNAEIRWFYTVFLQALGRYLDIKKSMEAYDNMFAYARAVLINYAQWMADKEYPYLEKPEILEFPNETWAAQDLRKADIFAVASDFATQQTSALFKEKAQFFFKHALGELNSFDTRFFTRPFAIVMSNGMPCLEIISQAKTSDMKEFKKKQYPEWNGRLIHTKTKGIDKILSHFKHFSLQKEVSWIKMQIHVRLGK